MDGDLRWFLRSKANSVAVLGCETDPRWLFHDLVGVKFDLMCAFHLHPPLGSAICNPDPAWPFFHQGQLWLGCELNPP